MLAEDSEPIPFPNPTYYKCQDLEYSSSMEQNGEKKTKKPIQQLGVMQHLNISKHQLEFWMNQISGLSEILKAFQVNLTILENAFSFS